MMNGIYLAMAMGIGQAEEPNRTVFHWVLNNEEKIKRKNIFVKSLTC